MWKMNKFLLILFLIIVTINVYGEDKNMELLRLFPRIAMVGDSLASGEIVDNDERALGVLYGGVHPDRGVVNEGPACHDLYESSWCSHICRRINAQSKHFTKGGITAKGWLEYINYYMAIDKIKYPLFFVALGANDFNCGFKLGTSKDTLKSDTFAGYYNEVIKSIKTINPHAVVLCLSMYYDDDESAPNALGDKRSDYSNMIKQITTNYEKVYYLDFAHECENVLNKTKHIRGGHYDSVGYLAISYEIEKLANKVLLENVDDLRDVTLYL